MGRGKSWGTEEDLGLCRAFVTTTAENTTDFFGRMYHHFLGLAPTEPGQEGDRWRGRTERALKKRLIVIRPTVLTFCKAYARVVAAGGYSEDRAVVAALEDFQAGCHNDSSKPPSHADNAFKFLHCWRILRDAPQFRTVCEGADPTVSALVRGAMNNNTADVLTDGLAADTAAAASAHLQQQVQQQQVQQQQQQPSSVPVHMAAGSTTGRKRHRPDSGTTAAAAAAPPAGLLSSSGAVNGGNVAMAGLSQAPGGEPHGALGHEARLVSGVGGSGGAAGVGGAAGAAGSFLKPPGEVAAAPLHTAVSELGRLAEIGERLIQVGEDLCGALVFQRSDANVLRRREFFEVLEERCLKSLRRAAERER
jgi:hypothetical protein